MAAIIPSFYALKPRFQKLLGPLCAALARKGVTANQLTMAASVLSILAGSLVWLWPEAGWPLLLVPPVLLARMALNALDGMLAREHAQASPAGAVLNELGDVVSDAALYLPLALVPGVPAGLVVIAVLLAVMTEMGGVLAVMIGQERRYDGPLGKSDRAVVFGGIALALGLGVPAGVWVQAVLLIVVPLLALTVATRVRGALRAAGP
ncbi:MAG: CDP-alcohol phosphatidyltransferase family protein [Alphaproteobacteria bacterium]